MNILFLYFATKNISANFPIKHTIGIIIWWYNRSIINETSQRKKISSIFKAIIFKEIMKSEGSEDLGWRDMERYLPMFTNVCTPNCVGRTQVLVKMCHGSIKGREEKAWEVLGLGVLTIKF